VNADYKQLSKLHVGPTAIGLLDQLPAACLLSLFYDIGYCRIIDITKQPRQRQSPERANERSVFYSNQMSLPFLVAIDYVHAPRHFYVTRAIAIINWCVLLARCKHYDAAE